MHFPDIVKAVKNKNDYYNYAPFIALDDYIIKYCDLFKKYI